MLCHSRSWIFFPFPSISLLQFFFFLVSCPPSSCYLLTPADLGSNNGRAGKADEVMDGLQPAEPGDANEVFSVLPRLSMACPNMSMSSFFFHVIRSSRA